MAKRMGRPPKDPEERKAVLIAFRTEDAEKADYERAASAAGVGLSDWIRDRLKRATKRELREQRQ
jgi:hypothetical protein